MITLQRPRWHRGIHRPGKRAALARSETRRISDGLTAEPRASLVAVDDPALQPLRWPFIPPELRASTAMRLRCVTTDTILFDSEQLKEMLANDNDDV